MSDEIDKLLKQMEAAALELRRDLQLRGDDHNFVSVVHLDQGCFGVWTGFYADHMVGIHLNVFGLKGLECS